MWGPSLTHQPGTFLQADAQEYTLRNRERKLANSLGLFLTIRSTEWRCTEPRPYSMPAGAAVLRVSTCCWSLEPRLSRKCTWPHPSMRQWREVSGPSRCTNHIGGLTANCTSQRYRVTVQEMPRPSLVGCVWLRVPEQQLQSARNFWKCWWGIQPPFFGPGNGFLSQTSHFLGSQSLGSPFWKLFAGVLGAAGPVRAVGVTSMSSTLLMSLSLLEENSSSPKAHKTSTTKINYESVWKPRLIGFLMED